MAEYIEIEGNENEVVKEEKTGFFKGIKAKVAKVPATAKYIACGVAGAAAVAVGGAVAGALHRGKEAREDWDGSAMTIEEAVAIDPTVVDETDPA